MNTHANSLGHDAAARARDAAQSMTDMAREAATSASKKVDEAAATAGQSMKDLSKKISERAPSEGVFASASKKVADSLYEGGEYLEETTLSGVCQSVAEMIKKNPLPAVLIGIGLGMMVGRITRR